MATNENHEQGCTCSTCRAEKRLSAGNSDDSASFGTGFDTWSVSTIVDNLTRSGRSWSADGGATPTQVTYSFFSAKPVGYGINGEESGFSSFNATQQLAAEKALDLWADVANVKFVKAEGAEGQIRFGNTTTGPQVAWGCWRTQL